MESTTTIVAKDGLNLFVRSWIPPQYQGVIALVHGFGEHSGRYQHVANFLNTNGFAVVAIDNRGHGKSEGQRGHAPSFESYYNDVESLIDYTQKTTKKDLPLFVYGHSLGGNLVLNTILRRHTEGISGIITTGPLIALAFKPSAFLLILGKLLRRIFPTLSQPGGVKPVHISRDKAVVDAYIKDPVVHGKVTTAAGMDLLEAADFLNTYAGKMPVPTLIMHGSDDFLTSQPASEAFAKRVEGDITYRKWDGLYHEIHNEPEKEQVFAALLTWLTTYVSH
jgi:alpha-beta hydrolase superfamily lysophospholipase